MLRIALIGALVLGIGVWLQLHAVHPWIGEPQTFLLAGSGLTFIALLRCPLRS